MKKNILASALVVGGLALSSLASAATVTTSFSLGPTTTELNNGNSTGIFNQFNSSLGTLTGVTIDLTGLSVSTTSLHNNASGSQTFKYTSTLDWSFDIFAGSGNIYDAFTTVLATTGNNTAYLKTVGTNVTLAAGANLNLGTRTETYDYSTNDTLLTGVTLSDFIGTGTLGIGCNTATTSSFTGGGGNILANQTTTGSCSGLITYTYTEGSPVPEPASLIIMGIGFFGMAALRKRRYS